MTYVPPTGPDFRHVELARDTLILIGPPSRLGAGIRPVAFHDLGAYPMIMDSVRQITRRLIDALASREEVKLDVVLDVDSVNLKREVIISEQCFAIVPRGLFSEAIDSGQFDWAPIVSPSIDRVLCLASRANFSLETFARIESMLTPCIESYIKNGRVNWHLVA